MIVRNSNFLSDLENGKLLKIDLGCGSNPKKGCYSLDQVDLDGVDVICDLNKPLSGIPDHSVEYIYSRHAFEHVDNLIQLMEELHRIVIPGGEIEIIVPHFSNVLAFSDPTHIRFFGILTMFYFVNKSKQPFERKVPDYYSNAKFVVKGLKVDFYRMGIVDKIFASTIEKLVNLNLFTQLLFERRFCKIFHASQIRFLLAPDVKCDH
ncbi:class I SAM-dependent methyltransferase [Desulfosediminicola ganghwensis]|uniref:class I SAM-dependent methyltransferase n=1 Tax=Desulfosediminicola ganghwensis TaxID=2569540 RepID=UPI0010AB8B3C|nr:methyltransferase domain-containing protein [Desulfosediminicola ganghwensis]